MKATINSERALYKHIEQLRKAFDKHKYIRADFKTGKQRTSLQNRSLHLYCEMVASELNERGITTVQFFDEGFEMPFTQDIVKDNIWRKVQVALLDKESTIDLERKECEKVYDIINLKLSERGLHIPWPCEDSR